MTGLRRGAAVSVLSVLSLVLCAYPSFAQRVTEDAPAYRIEQSPSKVMRGERVVLGVRFEGVSAAAFSVESIRLGSGLVLETQSVRPFTSVEGVHGVELALGLILQPSGSLDIETLSLVSAGTRFTIGPIPLTIVDDGSSGRGHAPIWEWRCPRQVRLHEGFELRLVSTAAGPVERDLRALFDPPAGAILESSGPLVWTVTALEEGRLVIPRARLFPAEGSSEPVGEAPALSVDVLGNEDETTPPASEAAVGGSPDSRVDYETLRLEMNPSAGAELAALYGIMRRTFFFEREHRDARAAAASIVASLGRVPGPDEVLLDALPPPKLFITAAAFFAVLSLMMFLLFARGIRRSARRRGRGPAPALGFAAAALFSLALGLAAALERRTVYAVVWTAEARTIPSSEAEFGVEIPLGSTAVLKSSSSGFSALSFADGVEVWVSSEYIFSY